MRGGGRSPPEQEKRFQKVFQKYREDIASIGTGSRGAAVASEREGGLVSATAFFNSSQASNDYRTHFGVPDIPKKTGNVTYYKMDTILIWGHTQVENG